MNFGITSRPPGAEFRGSTCPGRMSAKDSESELRKLEIGWFTIRVKLVEVIES